ncbi:hypothetical protein OF83DRAFT_1170463 [Amylostereum chailletii]|nr:hypothetical protein OF83DRAFT_1170463 [Amylostereum chailletii]
MSALSATLVVAGLIPSQGQAKAIVLAHVEVELRDIVGLALELNTSIGDGVVSRSLFPVLASHGAVFDGPTMVDDYVGDAPASPEERIVLCTRGMGLRCIIGGGEVTSRLLVPPKIVLKSIVDMLPRVGEMMPLGSPRSAATVLATV